MTSPQRRVSHHLARPSQVRLAVTITGDGVDGVVLNQEVGDLLRFVYSNFEVEVAPLTRAGRRREAPLFDVAAELGVADPFADEPGGVRWDDPVASHLGADACGPRTGNQKHQLFEAYVRDYLASGGDGTGPAGGLTAYDAGAITGLARRPRCVYWHRVSDLRAAGLLQRTGELRPTPGSDTPSHVLIVSRAGWRWWQENGWPL